MTPLPPTESPARRPSPRTTRRARRVLLGAGAAALVVVAAGARQREDAYALLRHVIALVEGEFVDAGGKNPFELAARGLVRELGDPYSELLSPKQLEDFSRASLGRYAGVGMEVEPVGDSVYVREVYPGSPSAGAGLRRGDRLVRVGGLPVDGLPVDSVVGRLRGAPNTTVAVDVERGTSAASAASVAVSMRRAVVRVPAVPYLIVERGVAYVPLPTVSDLSGYAVRSAFVRAAEEGARGIVLDVRGNPGGAVDEAVRVVSALLPEGLPVVEIRERRGSTVIRTERAGAPVTLPVVVLQDGASASAAEIIAGALQDHHRALVVGSRSYGKGLAQTVYPLDGGWALKLTTAKWFTPGGRSIHRDRTAGDSARRGTGTPPAVAADSARAADGGILPDVAVAYDTLVGAERAVALTLFGGGGRVADALARVARSVAPTADTGFVVAPAWRDALQRELTRQGVRVDSAQWRAAEPYVTRLLEQRVAEAAFGRAAARRRSLARDRHFLVADSLLRLAAPSTPVVRPS